jgi:hypothetical protein
MNVTPSTLLTRAESSWQEMPPTFILQREVKVNPPSKKKRGPCGTDDQKMKDHPLMSHTFAQSYFYLGMNTGLQDSYNLSWKLALVLHGLAPKSILDTFELERKVNQLFLLESRSS